jgi:hypothetical protein
MIDHRDPVMYEAIKIASKLISEELAEYGVIVTLRDLPMIIEAAEKLVRLGPSIIEEAREMVRGGER